MARTVRLSRATAEGACEGGAAVPRGDGGIVWGTRVDVLGAYRLRLHLTDVRLPAAARMWVYGAAETRGPFGGELAGPAGDLWTPSVAGGSLWLEVEIPAAALASGRSFGFTLPAVLEILPMGAGALGTISARVDTTCLVDGSCVQPAAFATMAQYRAAVASLDFVVGGLAGFFCTGTLLNDSRSSGIPYLLTADHCISSQETASTLEAVWDDYDATCNGPSPNRSALPVSEGATLLAAAIASDFSLLRLSSIPPGRVLLGWNADPAAVATGTPLFRLSHPFYAAGTDVGLKTTVTDTVTGAHKTYTNPIGTAAPPVQDTSAIPCG